MYGGPDRIRTDDPYNANVMRSQLRYRPKCCGGVTAAKLYDLAFGLSRVFSA